MGHGSGFLAAARELVAQSGADSEVLKSDAPAERVQQQLVNEVAKSLEESSSDTFKVLAQCLTDAVTKFDVAGYVADTTKRQRQEIRARLSVHVEPEDLDVFAGISSGHQFDRHEIHRMRTADPDQPLSVIAAKVGCSASTVKRHLRRVEEERGLGPRPSKPAPSVAQVMAVADDVRRGARRWPPDACGQTPASRPGKVNRR